MDKGITAGQGQFTPEAFMERATERGYLVSVSYLGEDAIKSLLLTKWLEQKSWNENDVRSECHWVLDEVPRIGGQVAGEGLDFRFGAVPGKKIPVIEVRLTLKAVEQKFLGQVDNLAGELRERAARTARTNLAFDTKVREEVENDAEVVRLRREVAQAQATMAEAAAALEIRQAELTVDKEKHREPFAYVAGGREV